MVDAKVVSIKELTENNPTLCLSPLRVFNKCHECQQFKQALRKHKTLEKTAEKLKCNPHINPKFLELSAKKRRLLDQLSVIDEEISKL